MKDDSGVPEVPTAFTHTQIQLKGMWDQVQDVHYLTLSCCIVVNSYKHNAQHAYLDLMAEVLECRADNAPRSAQAG